MDINSTKARGPMAVYGSKGENPGINIRTQVRRKYMLLALLN